MIPRVTTARRHDASGPSGRDVVGPLLIAVVFAGIVASYRDFVPYWDAKGYFDCVAHAARTSFDLLNYHCFGHATIAYLLPLVFTQYLAPWNVSLTYAANALLGTASIIAFHALLRLLFPKRSAVEYALVTALYAFAPLFVVHAIFLNLDYGMTAFFALFLYFLLARRFRLASVFAAAMMLSKETGAAVYAVTVAAYVIAFAIRTPLSWTERLAQLRLQAPLAAAPLAVASYVVAFRMLHPGPGSWVSSYAQVGMLGDPLNAFLNMNPADAGIRSFLADIFVLNYQWLYTGVLIAAVCAAVVRTGDRDQARSALAGSGLFLSLVLVPLVYVVTRYRDYNNARYVLVMSPVLVAAFYHALLSVFANGAARRLFLVVTVALVFVSNFRTVDVLSKAVFGTFTFGSHALLDMPSLLGGPRLDSTVYNLESLQYSYLLTDMMQDLRPAPRTVLFMGDTTHNFPPRVDARTYVPTVDPSHALPLAILAGDGDVQRDTLRTHVAGEGGRFFYMAFANADNHQLRLLLKEYPLVAAKRYERNGYTLDLYTFQFTSLR